MNQLALVFADITRSGDLNVSAISERLKKIKTKKSRFTSLGVSASTLSRRQKEEHFTFKRNPLWGEMIEALVRDLDVLSEGEAFETYLDGIAVDDELQLLVSNSLTRRYKPRVQATGERDWSPVEHLFGVWQTVNFSTFFETRPQNPKTVHIRSGLRFIGKHPETEEGRLRMKVVDLGKTTIWEGSADVDKSYIYMRMREESNRIHWGEGMYNIYGNPSTYHEVTAKRNSEYWTKGVVQVVVRNSDDADGHLFYGVSVLRYLPSLSKEYAKLTENLSRQVIESLDDNVRKAYCFREPLEALEEDINSGRKVGEQYHKLDQIVRWMEEPSNLDPVASTKGSYRFELGGPIRLV